MCKIDRAAEEMNEELDKQVGKLHDDVMKQIDWLRDTIRDHRENCKSEIKTLHEQTKLVADPYAHRSVDG